MDKNTKRTFSNWKPKERNGRMRVPCIMTGNTWKFLQLMRICGSIAPKYKELKKRYKIIEEIDNSLNKTNHKKF